MENKLAENIRNYRKNLGFTQEQLAEKLGVTLGAVSKWERGGSEPDLGIIMELAGLFNVSVDALIGYSMRGSDADDEAVRIEELVHRIPFEELAKEYDKALRRFPNHFRLVFGAAEACNRIGTMEKKEDYLKKALPLYRHAVELISQNRDPCINEVTVRNEMAGCYAALKDYKRAVEEYKKNNPSGSNNAMIGLVLIQNEKKPEEGIEYTRRAFMNVITESTFTMSGFIRYYMAAGDTKRGIRAAEWEINSLKSLKEDPDKRSFLDKILCLYYLGLAICQDTDGQTERSEESLRAAFRTARMFDDDPVYSFENVLFTEGTPESYYLYDDAGPTATEGLKGSLEEVGEYVSDSFRKKFMNLMQSSGV